MKFLSLRIIGILFIVCFSVNATAQSTLGRLLELEAKVAEKKMLDELEKSSVSNPAQFSGAPVPAISLINPVQKNAAMPIDDTPRRSAKRSLVTLSVFGVGNDLKADVIVKGVQYQVSKGGFAGDLLVKDIRPNGVVLEESTTVKKRQKSTSVTKTIFAPIAND